MSVSWDELTKPNFKLDFYFNNTLGLTPDAKYYYEEFLDNPKMNSMLFADSDADIYEIEDVNLSSLYKLADKKSNLNDLEIELPETDEEMIDNSDDEIDDTNDDDETL